MGWWRGPGEGQVKTYLAFLFGFIAVECDDDQDDVLGNILMYQAVIAFPNTDRKTELIEIDLSRHIIE